MCVSAILNCDSNRCVPAVFYRLMPIPSHSGLLVHRMAITCGNLIVHVFGSEKRTLHMAVSDSNGGRDYSHYTHYLFACEQVNKLNVMDDDDEWRVTFL